MHFFKRKYYQILLKYLKKKANEEERYVKAQYYLKNEKNLDLKNPTEFMEKIQWLKLNFYTEEYENYVDKYAVRTYVENLIGKAYLIDMIAIYNSVEDIKFDELPKQFVLKGTHGSGFNIIVKDKSQINISEVKKRLEKFMSKNYYERCREKIYRTIKPRILAETFLNELDGGDVIDYKFYCFHGKPKYVLVMSEEDGKRKKAFYNFNWEKVVPQNTTKSYLKSDIIRPNNFNKMIEIAEKLANDFIFVRVDLYSIGEKIYFGELTFFPNGGAVRLPVEKLNKTFGDLIVLPK